MTIQQSCTQSDVTVSYEQAVTDDAILIVDARSAREYAAGHIPGAASLPLADLQRAADDRGLADVFGAAGICNDTECVFYDNAYGAVASRVAMSLESVGGRARLLDVTYAVWKKDHAPGDAACSPDPVVFDIRTPSAAGGILTGIADVEQAAGSNDGGCMLLDARERLNYLSGHIPGAVNMPYHMFRDLENCKILRSPGDLKRIFENRGLDADKPVRIITYCGSAGTLSGLVYYALRRAGFANVSMYANSFREWNALEGRAVEAQQDATYWDLSAE